MADRRRGYTLIEVLVAMTITTLAALGIASLLLRGLATQRHALHYETADRLLSDAAEQLRANAGAAQTGLTPQQLDGWQQRIALRLPPGASTAAEGSIDAQPAYEGARHQQLSLHWGSSDGLESATLQRALLLPEPLAP